MSGITIHGNSSPVTSQVSFINEQGVLPRIIKRVVDYFQSPATKTLLSDLPVVLQAETISYIPELSSNSKAIERLELTEAVRSLHNTDAIKFREFLKEEKLDGLLYPQKSALTYFEDAKKIVLEYSSIFPKINMEEFFKDLGYSSIFPKGNIMRGKALKKHIASLPYSLENLKTLTPILKKRKVRLDLSFWDDLFINKIGLFSELLVDYDNFLLKVRKDHFFDLSTEQLEEFMQDVYTPRIEKTNFDHIEHLEVDSKSIEFIPSGIYRLRNLKVLDLRDLSYIRLPKELTTMPILSDSPQEPIRIIVNPNATIFRELEQPNEPSTTYRQLVIERGTMPPLPSRSEIIFRTAQDVLCMMKNAAPQVFIAFLAAHVWHKV